MNPARTVTEWLAEAEQTPRLTCTPVGLGGDEPSPTTATAADPDGDRYEEARQRQFDRFAA